MNDTIKSYKCPCCGAPLVFSADTQGLSCESCGAELEIEALKQLDEAERGGMNSSRYDWDKYEPRDFGGDSVDISSYSCPSCGAEVTGDESMGSTVCPYCGNSTIVKEQFAGGLKPDYIIPFSIDKKKAMAAFEAACQKAPFLPNEFKDKKKIQQMTGVYVPFWMFDCDCDAEIWYNAHRVHIWEDSRYRYTKTDFYKVVRAGSLGFANIPVDGSIKADDAYMEAVEPFDYSAAVDFDTAYLSGYLADRYDVTAEESIDRANERVKNSTERAFGDTVNGYASVVTERSNVSFSNGKIRYALLPVWMLNIKYKGENYKYAINGQTGKAAGIYPVDKGKQWRFFGIAYAVGLGICFAAAKLFGFI